MRAGARGAVLMRGAVRMRNCAHHVLAVITTDDMAELVQAYVAGRRPPNSRYGRVQYGSVARFRVDHDDYTDAELARDPYYQEFLRPAGYFWHANLPLTLGRDEFVELSLKRRIEAGPYQRADADELDAVVPDLLVAARLAKYTLDAEARGMARLLAQRGAPVFELDSWGRVLSRHAAEEDAAGPLRVIGRRLVASDRAAQPALDRAIARVLAVPGATALVPLTGPDGRRCFLQILPVPGRARDIFLSAAALAVLIDGGEPPRIRLDAATVAHWRSRSPGARQRWPACSPRVRRLPTSHGASTCRSAPFACTCAASSRRPGPIARPSWSHCSAGSPLTRLRASSDRARTGPVRGEAVLHNRVAGLRPVATPDTSFEVGGALRYGVSLRQRVR